MSDKTWYNKIGDNMKNRENLEQYLTYQKSEENLEKIFYILSILLEQIHKKGYQVEQLNAKTITIENGIPSFTILYKNKFLEKNRNIEDLSKIMIGAFLTLQSGFSDYTRLPVSYLRENYNVFEKAIESKYFNKAYFKNIIVNGEYEYYHKFIEKSKNDISNEMSKENQKTLQKSKVLPNNVGKLYTFEENNDRMSAFINVIFYPTLLLVFTIVLVISYNLYLFLQK